MNDGEREWRRERKKKYEHLRACERWGCEGEEKNQWPTDILCRGLAHSGQRGHIQPRAC